MLCSSLNGGCSHAAVRARSLSLQSCVSDCLVRCLVFYAPRPHLGLLNPPAPTVVVVVLALRRRVTHIMDGRTGGGWGTALGERAYMQCSQLQHQQQRTKKSFFLPHSLTLPSFPFPLIPHPIELLQGGQAYIHARSPLSSHLAPLHFLSSQE